MKHIISDIDVNIRAQMEIAKLKAEEKKLIDKQNELTHKIQQQQKLAQELSLQNQAKIEQLVQIPAWESKNQPNLFECYSSTHRVRIHKNRNNGRTLIGLFIIKATNYFVEKFIFASLYNFVLKNVKENTTHVILYRI